MFPKHLFRMMLLSCQHIAIQFLCLCILATTIATATHSFIHEVLYDLFEPFPGILL